MKILLLISSLALCSCANTGGAWSSSALRFEFGFKGVSVGVTIPERKAVYPTFDTSGKEPVQIQPTPAQ